MKKVSMILVLSVVLFVNVVGCTHTFIDISEGECQSDADCADGNVCTIDICGVDRFCLQIDRPDCVPPECTPTEEVCDGLDNDCDEVIDEDTYCAACSGGPIMPYYRDSDGDGYGDPSISEIMCSGLGATGWIDIAGDCDDSDPDIHPGALEACPYDELDNDCDGLTDEDVVTETRYRDSDGDGYGDPELSAIVCHDAPPVDGVLVAGDCNDGNQRVHPGATEVCDSIDNNCNGEADESDPHAGEFCWGMLSCGEPDCIVPVPGWLECRETFYGWSLECHLNCLPSETCDDGADNDCDTIVDDGCEPPTECTTDLDCARFDSECLVFHCLVNYCFAGERDDDGDGRSLCGGLPTGERYDCDDHDPAVHPGAVETCNGADDDCDGEIDEDYRADLGRVCTIFSSEGQCVGFDVITCNAPGEMYQLNCGSSLPGTRWSLRISEEMCGNGVDDDCDTVIDEDCP